MNTQIETNGGAQDASVFASKDLLCHVRMFKPQFAPLVEAGTKCQTVRPTPKRMPKSGDYISCREWTGKPYRSKQRVLNVAPICAVEKITICDTGRELLVSVGNKSLTPEELNAFAAADGFKDAIEMFNWFEATHGLPFEGVVIKWHNIQRSTSKGPERTCVYCGCTDSRACLGGCTWVELHAHTSTGVCSNCTASIKGLQRLDIGDFILIKPGIRGAGKLWMECKGGEAGDMSEAKLARHLEKFFRKEL